jgi:hypothetical protein
MRIFCAEYQPQSLKLFLSQSYPDLPAQLGFINVKKEAENLTLGHLKKT